MCVIIVASYCTLDLLGTNTANTFVVCKYELELTLVCNVRRVNVALVCRLWSSLCKVVKHGRTISLYFYCYTIAKYEVMQKWFPSGARVLIWFQMNYCVRVCVQKVPILSIFNMPFLPADASLGYQTFHRLGACRVLPKCGQLVPVLRQVRAWGTSEVQCFEMDFSRMLLAMAMMVSSAYAHTYCHVTSPKVHRCHNGCPLGGTSSVVYSDTCYSIPTDRRQLGSGMWIPHDKHWYAKRGEVHYCVSLVTIMDVRQMA